MSLLNPWVRTNFVAFPIERTRKGLEVRLDFGPRQGSSKQLFGSSREGTELDWTCFKTDPIISNNFRGRFLVSKAGYWGQSKGGHGKWLRNSYAIFRWCSTIAQLLRNSCASKPWITRGIACQPALYGNYCVAFCELLHRLLWTIASLPVTPFTLTPIPCLRLFCYHRVKQGLEVGVCPPVPQKRVLCVPFFRALLSVLCVPSFWALLKG